MHLQTKTQHRPRGQEDSRSSTATRCSRALERHAHPSGTDLAGRNRLLAGVIVEAAPGLPAEAAGFEMSHRKRAGTVFAIGKTLVQHLHDRQAAVAADLIARESRAYGSRMLAMRTASYCVLA